MTCWDAATSKTLRPRNWWTRFVEPFVSVNGILELVARRSPRSTTFTGRFTTVSTSRNRSPSASRRIDFNPHYQSPMVKEPPYVLYLELCNGRALKLLPGYKLPLACWLAMSPMLPQPLCKRPTRSWGMPRRTMMLVWNIGPWAPPKITLRSSPSPMQALPADLTCQVRVATLWRWWTRRWRKESRAITMFWVGDPGNLQEFPSAP